MNTLDRARWRAMIVVLPVTAALTLFGGAIMALSSSAGSAEVAVFAAVGIGFGLLALALGTNPQFLRPVIWIFTITLSAALLFRLGLAFHNPFYQNPENHAFPGVLPYMPLAYMMIYTMLNTRQARIFSLILWCATALLTLQFALPQTVVNAGRTGLFNLILFVFVAKPICIFMLAMVRAYADELIEESNTNQSPATEVVPEGDLQDSVTELYNREHFEGIAARSILAAGAEQRSIGVILIDVDYLKRYNDNCGYSAGDVLLRRIGKIIVARAPVSSVFIARIRGGEFAVLCDMMSKAEMLATAERIRHGVQKAGYQCSGDSDGAVTVSVGTCHLAVEPDLDLAGFLSRAGRALLDAQRAGGNLVMS